jgi:hypothetical protein
MGGNGRRRRGKAVRNGDWRDKVCDVS